MKSWWRMRAHILSILFLCAFKGLAQDIHFTQYRFAPGRINPSWITSDNQARVGLLYRTESIAEFKWKTTLLSSNFPLKVRNRMPKAGILFSFLDDKFEDRNVYAVQNVSVGFSYSIWTSKKSYLMLGLASGFNQKQINAGQFTTGSQYVQGVGFDPAASTNEENIFLKRNFLNLIGGMQYLVKDSLGRNKWATSMAFTDVNYRSFGEEENQRLKLLGLNVNTRLLLYSRPSFTLSAELFWQKFRSIQAFSLGCINRFTLKETKKDHTHFSLSFRYFASGSGAGIAELEHKDFLFTFSYQTGLHTMDHYVLQPNVVEFSLSYLVPVKGKKQPWKPRKRKNLKKKNALWKPREKRPPKQKPEQEQEETIGEESDSTMHHQLWKIEDTREISEPDSLLPAPDFIDSTYHTGTIVAGREDPSLQFEKNSMEIQETFKKKLDELAEILEKNSLATLLLIGYTDDTGPEDRNLQLSLARAEVVKEYFVFKGIERERLLTRGMGEKKPLVSNLNEISRALNRRVEIILFLQPSSAVKKK